MKIRANLLVMGLLAGSVIAGRSQAADLSTQERAFFDKHVAELVKVEPKRISDAAVMKAFSVPILEVEIKVKQGDGDQSMKVIVAHVGDQLVDVSRPSSDAAMPDFPKMVKNFKLLTDDDAKTLQTAFDVVYPVFGDDDKKAVAFKHTGMEWTFIRGKFFDKQMGFVIKTDAKGTITSASFSLKLP